MCPGLVMAPAAPFIVETRWCHTTMKIYAGIELGINELWTGQQS